MARAFARHGAENYDAWRESYDGFHERRRELEMRA